MEAGAREHAALVLVVSYVLVVVVAAGTVATVSTDIATTVEAFADIIIGI